MAAREEESTMVQDVQRAIEGYRAHALSWGRIEQGLSAEVDELLVVATGIPRPLMNRIVATSMPNDPAASLQRTRQLIEERPVPYILELFPEAGGLRELVEDEGFREMAQVPLMTHADPAGVDAPEVPGLVAHVPSDLDELRAWSKALTEGFGMPGDLASAFAWPELLDASDWRAFSGVRDGAVIGTAMSCFGGGVTGVFSVTTIESERRRGIGAALTVAAMRAGVEAGDDLAYLQASPMGKPVYEKLGFVTVCDSVLFMRSPDANAS